MQLLYSDTKVSPAAMVQMFREFVDELSGVQKLLQSPPGTVKDALRLETGRDLLSDTLALVGSMDPSQLGREELRRWVNLQYDVSRSSVECLKGSVEMPSVPRSRAKS